MLLEEKQNIALYFEEISLSPSKIKAIYAIMGLSDEACIEVELAMDSFEEGNNGN